MSLVPEIDFGTPASRSEKMVTLTIDGNEISVPEGTSIMRASMEAGIQVPKLCATALKYPNRLPSGVGAIPRLRTMLSTAVVLVFTSLVCSASSSK